MKLASCTPQPFSSRISFGKKGHDFPLLSVHFPFVGFSGSHPSIKLKPLGSLNLSTKVLTISESTLMCSNISGSPPSKLWKDYTSHPTKPPAGCGHKTCLDQLTVSWNDGWSLWRLMCHPSCSVSCTTSKINIPEGRNSRGRNSRRQKLCEDKPKQRTLLAWEHTGHISNK